MELVKIQMPVAPYKIGDSWNYYLIAVFEKFIAIMRGGSDHDWRILRNDHLPPSRYVDAILDAERIFAVTSPRATFMSGSRLCGVSIVYCR